MSSDMGSVVSDPISTLRYANYIKEKKECVLFMEIYLTTTECHLPYGITQCYLPPDTSERTSPLPQPNRLVLDLPTISGWRVE